MGTYGVSRSSLQATAGDAEMSPFASASFTARSALPRKPLVRRTSPSRVDRGGDRVLGHARRLPHEVTGGPVVAADLVGGTRHDLRPARVRHDQRRCPRGLLVALLPPELAAGLPGRGRRSRRVRLVVPLDEQPVPVEGGRAALPEGQLDVHVAEVLLPEDLAVRVERVETARAEVGEDELAVRHRRRRGPGAGRVRALVRQLLADDSLPEDLPVAAPEGQHRELLRGVGGRAEAGRPPAAGGSAGGVATAGARFARHRGHT